MTPLLCKGFEISMKNLFLILLISISVPGQSSDPPPLVTVIAKKANVRITPSMRAGIVGTVVKGSVLAALRNSGAWYYIKSSKIQGWVHYTALKKGGDNTEDEFAAFLNHKKPKVAPRKKDYSSVYEDEWLLYGTSNNENEYYNPAKMTRTGFVVSVWTKGRDKFTDSLIETSLLQIDCQASKYRSAAGVRYNPNGSVSRSWENASVSWSIIIPDTIAESLMNTVCKVAN
jgi:Bacterial SH3 domain